MEFAFSKFMEKIPVHLFIENHLENYFEFQCENDFLNHIPLFGNFKLRNLYRVIIVEIAVSKFKVNLSLEPTLNFDVQMFSGTRFRILYLLRMLCKTTLNFHMQMFTGTTFRIFG